MNAVETNARETATAVVNVENVSVGFPIDGHYARAVDRVSLTLQPGSTLGLVGESGSGKSTLGLAVLGMLPPAARVLEGRIVVDGHEMSGSEKEARAARWTSVAMAFQNAMAALNPVMTIERQFFLAMRQHLGSDRASASRRAAELLERVGVSASRLKSYPHELSGGQKQRVMIALAICCNPRVLIADEPTTALDVVAQAQVLELIKELQREMGMAVLMISHDLGAVAELCSDIAVMYAGQIVEQGPTVEVLASPRNPYTVSLRHAYPPLHADVERLWTITGQPPAIANPPAGCRFNPRCYQVEDICRTAEPLLIASTKTQLSRCHFALEPARIPDNLRAAGGKQ